MKNVRTEKGNVSYQKRMGLVWMDFLLKTQD